jgi:hypothetical protein
MVGGRPFVSSINNKGEWLRVRSLISAVWLSGCLTPLASALNAMLADLPLAIAEELDTGAVDKQVQRPIGAPVGDFGPPVSSATDTGSCSPARPSPASPSSRGWPPARSFA